MTEEIKNLFNNTKTRFHKYKKYFSTYEELLKNYKDKDITEVDSVKAEKELLQEDVDSLVNEVTDNDNVEEEPVAIENQTEDEPKGLMARRTM